MNCSTGILVYPHDGGINKIKDQDQLRTNCPIFWTPMYPVLSVPFDQSWHVFLTVVCFKTIPSNLWLFLPSVQTQITVALKLKKANNNIIFNKIYQYLTLAPTSEIHSRDYAFTVAAWIRFTPNMHNPVSSEQIYLGVVLQVVIRILFVFFTEV